MTNAAKTLNVTDLAEVLGTDARTARKFLRSITPKDAQPGKGSRWAIEGNAASIKSLKGKYADFEAKMRAKNNDAPEAEGE